jgi:hypothetical protein
MKPVELRSATAPLADYARDVAKEPVIVTDRGWQLRRLFPSKTRTWKQQR